MSLTTIIITAFALAMDAFAISLATGLSEKNRVKINARRCGLAFGVFQAGMTFIGWLIGFAFYNYIKPVDHWVAFGLLAFIGGKMIYESFSLEDIKPLIKFRMLIALALLTSIDALAAGLSFSALDAPILLPALIIGVTTLVLSFTGVYLGAKLSHVEVLEKYADRIGGLVLIGIGIHIFVTHVVNGI